MYHVCMYDAIFITGCPSVINETIIVISFGLLSTLVKFMKGVLPGVQLQTHDNTCISLASSRSVTF